MAIAVPDADTVRQQIEANAGPGEEAGDDLVALATYQRMTGAQIDATRVSGCSKVAAVLPCRAGTATVGQDEVPLEAYVHAERLLSTGDDGRLEEVLVDDVPEDGEELDLGTLLLAAAEEALTLDYVLFPAMSYGVGPADNPTSVGDTWESVPLNDDPQAGDGGTIVVADSGYPDRAVPTGLGFLAKVQWQGSLEELPQATSDPATAHGLMVAGIAGQKAPEATVIVLDATDEAKIANPFANGFESQMITVLSLQRSLLRYDPLGESVAVLNMSFGTYGCDPDLLIEDLQQAGKLDDDEIDTVRRYIADREDLRGLETLFLEETIKTRFTHLVAAAGNSGTDKRFYPAAFDDVIGVGAVDETVPNGVGCGPAWTVFETLQGPEADRPECAADPTAPYSNHGPWVDVCLPGTDVVTAYPSDLVFHYLDLVNGHPEIVDSAVPGSLVRISGTSFAAPHVSAWLAAGLPVTEVAGFECPS
ncbi:MAG: S8/S53 family peptidase [Actinomycetota bacterium]